MTEDTDEVDLRPDDDATLDEMEADAEEAPVEEPPVEEPEDEASLEEEARELAVEYRNNAGGDDTLERLGNALEGASGDAEKLGQMHSQHEQRAEETAQRIDRLEETAERVVSQPDDVPVLQTMAGGISLQVPSDHATAYDRDDLLEEIDETIEALEGTTDEAEEQMEAVRGAYEKTSLAVQLLERAYEKQKQTDELAGDLID